MFLGQLILNLKVVFTYSTQEPICYPYPQEPILDNFQNNPEKNHFYVFGAADFES